MKKILCVSANGSLWKVHWQEETQGNKYTVKDDAIWAAKKKVSALAAGTCSQILIQETDGTLKVEWNYDKDSFPPAL